ncbi:MAG TPA: dihydroorotase [Candidatus Sulfomarinibacteraceae bacterium]|nr:dihydroorotase [Candidatus Sulfomarinibacteraceae bacterium]
MATIDVLEITRPDDWHLHLRDGAAMADAVGHSAAVFARAVVMPNLRPPVTGVDQARAYRDRIVAAVAPQLGFEPLMTLYLTDRTSPAEVGRARKEGVAAFKLYPAGATTNSDAGVTDLGAVAATLEAMEAHGMPLLVHGEVTDPEVDIFDREAVFIDRVLEPLLERHQGLRLVFEHVTTTEAVDFVRAAPGRVGATITPQHLLLNRNAILAGGVQPHHYCLPVLKRESHRRALVAAATGDDPRFFLGTDSAPHPRSAKEAACGCAGCFSAPVALALYAEAFDAAGALDRLEAFASHRGADFYGLPRNRGRVRLVRERRTVPEQVRFGDDVVVPLRAGGHVAWTTERVE